MNIRLAYIGYPVPPMWHMFLFDKKYVIISKFDRQVPAGSVTMLRNRIRQAVRDGYGEAPGPWRAFLLMDCSSSDRAIVLTTDNAPWLDPASETKAGGADKDSTYVEVAYGEPAQVVTAAITHLRMLS